MDHGRRMPSVRYGQCLVESGVQTQLRLVHAYREANYVESTTSKPGFRDDLFRLQNPSDGYLDRVHTMRALYGADMVSMIAGTMQIVSARANA
jgi:peptidyl-Asp metalloendopeptidase